MTSLASLKETCSDFLLVILKNPPGGDSNLAWKTIDDFQRSTEDGLSLCVSVEMRSLTSLASLKESCLDFLLDILKNPPEGDSRLDMEDVINYFKQMTQIDCSPVVL